MSHFIDHYGIAVLLALGVAYVWMTCRQMSRGEEALREAKRSLAEHGIYLSDCDMFRLWLGTPLEKVLHR